MSLINRLTQLAKSEKGKELIDKAQAYANDPKTRAKIEDAREKIVDQVDAAKQKLAEKRAKDEEAKGTDGAAAEAAGSDGAATAGTAVADEPAAEAPAAPPADPPAPDAGDGDSDGPKAA